MGKFSDAPYHLLKNYFDARTTTGESNVLISGSVLKGHRASITARGGYWTRLFIKVDTVNYEDAEYPGFIEYKFKPKESNYITDNDFNFELGALVTLPASANGSFDNGSEVYFRKDSYLHSWVRKNLSSYDDFVNPRIQFLYFGKIYSIASTENDYRIIFDGMKDYVMRALPDHNRTENLTEFMKIYFDNIYHKIYNLTKNINTLLDYKEVDLDYIQYLASMYGMTIDETMTEDRLREWVKNLVYLLKRKGTYTAIYIIWKTFLANTTNHLNIYNRWHVNLTDITDIPLDHFVDYLHEMDYGRRPLGCAGSYWYEKAFASIASSTIFTQVDANTVWYVRHEMYTKDVIIQCYENISATDYRRIMPAEVESISTGIVKVTFGTAVAGFAYLVRKGDHVHKQLTADDTWNITHNRDLQTIISQYHDTNSKRIIPDSVTLTSKDILAAEFAEVTAGRAMLLDVDNTDPNEYVHTQSVAATTWTITHNLGVQGCFVQIFDSDYKMVLPISLSLTSINSCIVTLHTAITGYALVKSAGTGTTLPTYDLDDMILSPHYKVEIDLSCEPIDGDSMPATIISEETIDRLITNWELIRPVSRYAHYHELISPITDFTSNYRSLYEKGYEAYLYTKYCASASEFLPSPSADTILHNQYINADTWTITHTLNSKNWVVQCYDSEDNRIWPNDIKTISYAEVQLIFDHATNGTACLVEGAAPSGATNDFLELQTSWAVNHALGLKNVIAQFDNLQFEKNVPLSVHLDAVSNLTAEWNSLQTGYSISIATSYVHVEPTPTVTWTINHLLGSDAIVTQFYDDNDYLISPASVTLSSRDTCVATFGTAVSGYAILRPISKSFTEADVMEKIENGGYWMLGNGTDGVAYDPLVTNSVQSMLISGSDFDYDSDNDYYYLTLEVSDLDSDQTDWDITEIAWINRDNKIRFYTYCSPMHKPGTVWFNSHLRIEKQQA